MKQPPKKRDRTDERLFAIRFFVNGRRVRSHKLTKRQAHIFLKATQARVHLPQKSLQSKMKYTVVHTSDSGSVSLMVLDKAELEKRLNEEYWGTAPILAAAIGHHHDLLATHGTFIIPGMPVQPTPVTTVKEWRLP